MAKKKKREIKKKRESKKKKILAELPEPIIQHILSFLQERYAIKTSILSKAWLRAWRTKPNLEFDYNLLYEMHRKMLNMGSGSGSVSGSGSGVKEKIGKKFSKYIKRTLKRYTQQKISIEKLKLDLISTGDMFSNSQADSLVKRCTRVALERGVKNLHLSASFCELPLIVLGAKSLENLRLEEFKMPHLSTEKIMWHSLKRLCLNNVCLDEVMFENIISSCPLLEILEIDDQFNEVDDEIDGIDDRLGNQLQFKVIEHRNLKQLNVRLCRSQSLILGEAPKLESLICTSHYDYEYEWIPGGFGLHSSQSQYQNLKMLDLCAVDISDDFFNNFQHKFPHLQDLLLRHCQSLRRIQISSPSLERIHFVENYELEEAQFDAPSIELLEYKCDMNYELEEAQFDAPIIPEFSFSTATKGHWISKLRIRWRGNVDSSWFLQLKKLLVSLIPSDIFLNIAIDGSIELDMNEMRNSSTFGEPQELQELTLDINSSSILSALDGFFSICRPNSISQQSWGSCVHKDVQLMKLLYEMLMLRTNQDEHHKLQKQIKCWQHDLRQVQVQIYYYGWCRVGNTPVYVKKELVDEPPEALDWESILKVWSPFRERIIHVALDWTKHGLSKKKKRCQKKKQKN